MTPTTAGLALAVLLLGACQSGSEARRRPTAVATTTATTTIPAAVATTVPPPNVDVARLSELVEQAPRDSCLVVGSDQQILFARRADDALVPASAIKLVTAAAALAHLPANERLGEDGRTVAELVAAALSESDNAAAQRLLVALGERAVGEASAEAGAREAPRTLALAGIPVGGLVVTDGAGLDRGNRASCRTLYTILQVGAGGALEAGLAVAGERGTLADRFLGTPAVGRLRGKTGSLRGVSALAGIVSDPGGARLTFAFVVNGLESAQVGEALQDALVAAILAYRPGDG